MWRSRGLVSLRSVTCQASRVSHVRVGRTAHQCRPTASEGVTTPGPVLLFRARSLKEESGNVETAITQATIGMSGGIGLAFLGLAPLTSPNLFMIGLLLAIVQVQFGYSFLMRQLYVQRRRWVMELQHHEEKHLVTVVCDGNLTRIWTLSSDVATEEKPSMQDITEKGNLFFFLDREIGEILEPEALDHLLASPNSIEVEEVQVKPVLGETEDMSKRIVQSFTALTRTNLQQMKDGGSPLKQLEVLERAAQVSGFSFLTMGLFFYVAGKWSAQNAIDRAAQSYSSSSSSPGSPTTS